MIQYIKQFLGHLTHGVGKFKYQTKREHYTKIYCSEKLCNCDWCQEWRKSDKKYFTTT